MPKAIEELEREAGLKVFDNMGRLINKCQVIGDGLDAGINLKACFDFQNNYSYFNLVLEANIRGTEVKRSIELEYDFDFEKVSDSIDEFKSKLSYMA